MKIIFQGSQNRHVRVAISSNGLGQFFQKLYSQHIQGPKANTQPLVLMVTTSRLRSALGTMCEEGEVDLRRESRDIWCECKRNIWNKVAHGKTHDKLPTLLWDGAWKLVSLVVKVKGLLSSRHNWEATLTQNLNQWFSFLATAGKVSSLRGLTLCSRRRKGCNLVWRWFTNTTIFVAKLDFPSSLLPFPRLKEIKEAAECKPKARR